MPLVFVSVTLTEATSAALPDTVNGTVSMNWPPYWFEAELEYQVENAGPTCTVIVLCESVLPVVGAKVNAPLTISRVVEYPITVTVRLPPVFEYLTD